MTVAPSDPVTARTWSAHMLDPSTNDTACRHTIGLRPTHGAHHPNGSPGGRTDNGADTITSVAPDPPPRDAGRMTWDRTTPRDPRYGAQHRRTRDAHMRALRRAGAGICAETRNPGSRCLHRSAVITPDMPLHLCHNSLTGEVLGLGHADCNIADGARRGRQAQRRRAHTRRPHTHEQSRLTW